MHCCYCLVYKMSTDEDLDLLNKSANLLEFEGHNLLDKTKHLEVLLLMKFEN